MQSTLIALLGLSAFATAAPSWSSDFVTADNIQREFLAKNLFGEFTNKYNKNYSDEESTAKYAVFRTNLDRIAQLNEKNGSPAFGINEFADMTALEFAKTHLGYIPAQPGTKADQTRRATPVFQHNQLGANVTAIDWRTKGAVTPVKDQGQCGSCWAFSAVEQIESAYFLGGHAIPTLSPQQVVSCDKVDGGCNGGDTPSAYDYVKTNGLEPESAYPYKSGTSGATGTCTYKAASATVKIKGFTYATEPCYDDCTDTDEATLAANIGTKGPASICVNAEEWQLYTSGVMSAKSCGPSDYYSLNHCVQVTGFDIASKTPYWNIRNSWGTSWGEAGYIRVAYNGNSCGIADEATFVTL